MGSNCREAGCFCFTYACLCVCVCVVCCVVDSDVSLANSRAMVLAPKTSEGDLIWRWVFPHMQVKARP